MSRQSLQSWTARFHYQLLAWCTADMYTRYMECRSVETCGIQQVQQLIYKCNPCIFHPIKFKILSGLSNYNPYSSVTHLQSHLYVHTPISTEKFSGQLTLYLGSGATLGSYCHVQYLQQKDREELITEVRYIVRDKIETLTVHTFISCVDPWKPAHQCLQKPLLPVLPHGYLNFWHCSLIAWCSSCPQVVCFKELSILCIAPSPKGSLEHTSPLCVVCWLKFKF